MCDSYCKLNHVLIIFPLDSWKPRSSTHPQQKSPTQIPDFVGTKFNPLQRGSLRRTAEESAVTPPFLRINKLYIYGRRGILAEFHGGNPIRFVWTAKLTSFRLLSTVAGHQSRWAVFSCAKRVHAVIWYAWGLHSSPCWGNWKIQGHRIVATSQVTSNSGCNATNTRNYESRKLEPSTYWEDQGTRRLLQHTTSRWLPSRLVCYLLLGFVYSTSSVSLIPLPQAGTIFSVRQSRTRSRSMIQTQLASVRSHVPIGMMTIVYQRLTLVTTNSLNLPTHNTDAKNPLTDWLNLLETWTVNASLRVWLIRGFLCILPQLHHSVFRTIDSNSAQYLSGYLEFSV